MSKLVRAFIELGDRAFLCVNCGHAGIEHSRTRGYCTGGASGTFGFGLFKTFQRCACHRFVPDYGRCVTYNWTDAGDPRSGASESAPSPPEE